MIGDSSNFCENGLEIDNILVNNMKDKQTKLKK